MNARLVACAALFVAVFAASACQTMSVDECQTADWRGLGRSDAADGGASRLPARTESCARGNITPDGAAYQTGFGEGMRDFCTPAHGFQFASAGRTFAGSCPDDQEADFRPAYADGQTVAEADRVAANARSRVNYLESRNADIIDQLRRHPDNTRLAGELERNRSELPGARVDAVNRESEARRIRFSLSRHWIK